MKTLDLTIGIPTYNRREDLERLLSSLQPLFAISSFDMIISDNASDYDLNPLMDKFISNKWPWIRLKIIKNKINLGAGPNILRIIEGCDTKWVMIIGDDDEADADLFRSLSLVCEKFNGDSEIIGVKFSSNLDIYQNNEKINKLDDFLSYISDPTRLSSMILISSWLFRTANISQYLRQSYQFSTLYLPHIIPVLLSLNSGGYILLSSNKAIRWNPPTRGQGWSYVSTFMPMLVTLPLFSEIFKDNKRIQKFISGVLSSYKSKIKFFCLIFLSNNYSMNSKLICSRQIASYSFSLLISRYISIMIVLMLFLARTLKINIHHSLIDSGYNDRL